MDAFNRQFDVRSDPSYFVLVVRVAVATERACPLKKNTPAPQTHNSILREYSTHAQNSSLDVWRRLNRVHGSQRQMNAGGCRVDLSHAYYEWGSTRNLRWLFL